VNDDAGGVLYFRDTFNNATSYGGIVATDAGPLVLPAKFPPTIDDGAGPASMYLR
jgi:hypothetical protein